MTSYDIFSFATDFVLQVFFREIKTRNSHFIPAEGPVIFVCAPHANQFVDALLVHTQVTRPIGFLIAEKSMKRKMVGAFARAMNSIPVTRPQDLAKPATGSIYILGSDFTRVHGYSTRFTQEFQVGWSLMLPKEKGSLVIKEIVSDTEVLLAKPCEAEEQLAMLQAEGGSPFKCMPIVDQSKVYEAVHQRLSEGGCIGIFPEGGSHDRAEMLPLKAGVTIMALGAMAKQPDLNLKIIPCGLNYFHPDKFRSRAVLEFGPPMTIDPELVEGFKKGGPDKRQACGKLLDDIYQQLKLVTVNTPDYESLMLLQASKRLYRSPGLKDAATSVMMTRRLALHYDDVVQDPRFSVMKEKVMAYNNLLSSYGLRDHQVERASLGRFEALRALTKGLTWLLLMSIPALPGAILHAPLLVTAKVFSRKKAKEAVAQSSVKIVGKDVIATWKLLVACVVLPVLYVFYGAVTFAVSSSSLPLTARAGLSLLTMVTVPWMGWIAVQYGEKSLNIYQSLLPLFMQVTRSTQVQSLKEMRESLSLEMTRIINEYGEQLYPDEKDRLFRSDLTTL